MRKLTFSVVAGLTVVSQALAAGPLQRPAIIKASEAEYPGIQSRQRQGIPSLAVLPGGRIWATWYAGPSGGEDENNYVVLATSGDDGLSWDEVLVVDPDGPGPLRAFDSEIWVDPFGKLWFFFAIADDGVVTAHERPFFTVPQKISEAPRAISLMDRSTLGTVTIDDQQKEKK